MNYQAKLLDEYDKIREYEAKQLKERKAEIQKLYPEIIELDQQIQKLSVNMSLALIKSEDSEKTFKEYTEELPGDMDANLTNRYIKCKQRGIIPLNFRHIFTFNKKEETTNGYLLNHIFDFN